MKTRILLLASIIVLSGVDFAWPQVDKVLRVEVSFPFTVGSKELPAGRYDISKEALNNAIRVTSVTGGESGDAVIMARLWAGIHTTPKDSHIVFDQVGSKYFFSELWIPGEDGYLFKVTQGGHTYKIISVP
jgi:hypothetical protein